MDNDVLTEIRSVPNLSNAILRPLLVNRAQRLVTVRIITDKTFTPQDEREACTKIRAFVPEYFSCEVEISKLSPDCEMVKRKVYEGVSACSKAAFAVLGENGVAVTRTDDGFSYVLTLPKLFINDALTQAVTDYLKKSFCGNFVGEIIESESGLSDLEVEKVADDIEYEIPVRKFEIADFEILEGDKVRTTAVYVADLNFVSEEVVICGTLEDIRERTYERNGAQKSLLSLTISDGTAHITVTYFIRKKSEDKIRKLKIGDSVVLTGVNEEFRGSLRFTAKTIDLGKTPKDFVPEKKPSKPVPVNYRYVAPQPFSDAEQTDLFKSGKIPDCLKGKTFVVFDLETTGLNSSPASGNMDKIIEIGAFKVIDGEIKESFTTFVNPQTALSDEIVNLTGINQGMVEGAPTYEQVMPDFYKFCFGSVLVGHNIVNFDFRFIDYYLSKCGYIIERKLIDTYPLSQELLYLSNYKLNTVAEKFGVTFNHHRAIDDALATAKIFIELIKMKKTLPKLQ